MIELGSVLTWCGATGLAYGFALQAQRRVGLRWYTLPVVTGTALVLLALWSSGTAYGPYAQATHWLQRLAGPAVVALAVPLYQQTAFWRQRFAAILAAGAAGCLAALLSGWLLGWLLGLPRDLLLSLLPRSATMPMAMAAAGEVGGVPALAAAGVVVTGVVGSALVPPLLRVLRCSASAPTALTLGLVAHAIGIAKARQEGPQALALAALAMGLMGVLTVLLLPLLARWV